MEDIMEFPQINTQEPESVYETPDIKPIKPKHKWKRGYKSFVSKLVSSSIHSSALLAALLFFSIREPGQDYIVSQAKTPETPLEVSIELPPPEIEFLAFAPPDMDYLLDQLSDPEIIIKPPDEILRKSPENLTFEDIKELIYISQANIDKVYKEDKKSLTLSLEELIPLDEAVVSDASAEEIIKKERKARGLEGKEKDYSPKNKVSMDKIDVDSMVPHYRVAKESEKWFEAGVVAKNGDYEIKLSKPFYEVDEYEKAQLEKFQKANIPYKLKKQVRALDSNKGGAIFYIRALKQEGEVFQELWVNPDGTYRIARQKPESKMTLMERLRLKAFELTEGNERHKRYRNLALEYADKEVSKKQEAKEQGKQNNN